MPHIARLAKILWIALVLSTLSTVPWAWPSASAYTPHAPIQIDGNAQFIPANGVTGGSGTPGDPYVIEGWDIDASTAHGIEIRNTDAPFIIRGVLVHSGSLWYDGVRLYNVTQGQVANGNISNSWYGIELWYSTDVSISAANISSNSGYGVYVGYFANVSISAANISLNNWDGLYLWHSANVSVSVVDVFSNSGSGIDLSYSTNVSISAASLSNNSDGLYLWYSTNVSLSAADFSLNSGYDIYLGYSTDVSISAANASYIYLGYSTDVSISAANASYIYVDSSANVSISAANASSNNWYGINLEYSTNVSITAANISSINGYGIRLISSTNVSISAANISSINGYGLYLEFSTNVSISDAILTNNWYGVYLTYSTNVSVSDATLSNSWYGIDLSYSTNVSIYHNAILNNSIQANDNMGPENAWDDGYPAGGNYWSDYMGSDNCSGPLQNVCPDPDGIGDTPYVIDGDSRDRYPLMRSSWGNLAPTANAGPDQPGGYRNTEVILDGMASSDPDGDPLTFSWIQTAGPPVVLTGADTATPAFTPVAAGTYAFQLMVNDGLDWSDPDIVTVTAVNRSPTANAGPDQLGAFRGVLATLDGTGSADLDGDALNYLWTQTSGPAVTLSNSSAASSTFIPAQIGTYTFGLSVDDGNGGMSATQVAVTVINQAPTAAAFVLPSTSVNKGAPVTLDGTRSSDPDTMDALTYLWTQTAGPAVALTGGDTATPSFTPAAAGLYMFELTVDDHLFGGMDVDTVTVTVVDRAPVANAGGPYACRAGESITLDGSGSTDPDGDALTYEWTVHLTPAVTLSDLKPTFPCPGTEGTLAVSLAAMDTDGLSSTDDAQLLVRSAGGLGNWTLPFLVVFAPALLFLVLLLAFRKRGKREGEASQPVDMPEEAGKPQELTEVAESEEAEAETDSGGEETGTEGVPHSMPPR